MIFLAFPSICKLSFLIGSPIHQHEPTSLALISSWRISPIRVVARRKRQLNLDTRIQATPRSHGRRAARALPCPPPGARSRFTPRPDMRAGLTSAVGYRSTAFSGRTFPSISQDAPGLCCFAFLPFCQCVRSVSQHNDPLAAYRTHKRVTERHLGTPKREF